MAGSALVAVEIAPPDAGTALKQSLLDACSRAAEERCTEPQGEQTEPNIVAIVSWRDPLHARLEVALRREQRWVVRTMAFADQDAPEERWRAVGLVIGTLASLIARNIEPPPADGEARPTTTPSGPGGTPPPAPAPPASADRAAPPAEEPDHVAPPAIVESPTYEPPPRTAWLGIAVVVGSALDRGAPRVGGELDGHLRLAGDLYGLVGGSYSAATARVDGVQTSFAEAFAGLLYARDLGHAFTATFRAEGLLERFAPSIDSASGGATEGERWLGGARAGVDAFYWGLEPVGFFLGGGIKWTPAPTDVEVSGKYVGSTPTIGYVFRAGTSFAFR
jgi:hypothetical protein